MGINYLQIFDYDLNISKRLNQSIELLPNEWIVLTDLDTLKFPEFPNQVKKILNGADKNWLIGSSTNRLNPNNPQVIKEMYQEDSISAHFDKSLELWEKYGTTLEPTKIIAGSCMIFHKELWSKVGGFDENKIFFDKYFSYKVDKCLIAKGLYILHLYRWFSNDPVSSVKHLVKP
jgi:hypothetical protein